MTTDRAADALTAAILAAIESCHSDSLLFGGDPHSIDPSGWTRSTFPEAARRIAAALAPMDGNPDHAARPCDLGWNHTGSCWYESGTEDD